jgi:hypothetical protein
MKIDNDTLAEIIFNENEFHQEWETVEEETGKVFKLQWSNVIPSAKSRYMLITDSDGKTYQCKISLSFSQLKLVK